MDWLLDSTHFVTRDHCGTWSDSLILVYQLANFLIFLAYMTIPLSLLSMWQDNRPRKKSSLMTAMFATFIFACGFTHLMDVLAFSWPAYRFFALVDVVTALASIPTAFLLPGVIRSSRGRREED